jgi:hypothetical protein
MSELMLDIQECLEEGMSHAETARFLNVPMSFVEAVAETMDRDEELPY